MENITEEQREGMRVILLWYSDFTTGGSKRLSKEDYEFLYNVWDSKITIYGPIIQKRLNQIRKIYLTNKRK